MGPASVINKMKSILGHVGAWAPMAEQKAVAIFLGKKKEIENYLLHFKNRIRRKIAWYSCRVS
jgi:aspartate aminotransferase